MSIASKLMFASAVLAAHTVAAEPDVAGTTEPASEDVLRPPAEVDVLPKPPPPVHKNGITGTTERWGGGVRLTGLSGIGALPGVNYGGEVAGQVRRDEYFIELALGRWKPEETHLVTETPVPIELALDVWTLRGGWTSMQMPLRAWVLAEVGEVAGMRAMPGVITRMVSGTNKQTRSWEAIGAGLGIAWPMSDQARLVGNLEFAVPVKRDTLMLEHGEYKPDPLSARYSVGLEVGWR